MKTRTSTNTDMATITVMRANMNTMMARSLPLPRRDACPVDHPQRDLAHRAGLGIHFSGDADSGRRARDVRRVRDRAVPARQRDTRCPGFGACRLIPQLLGERGHYAAVSGRRTATGADARRHAHFRRRGLSGPVPHQRSARENAVFLIMMYVIGAGWGLILSAFGL